MAFDRISRRGALKLGALLSGGALAAPSIIRNGLAAAPIKLGSLLDGSGPIGISGARMIQTTDYAVGLLNASGGLLGRQVQLINYDTQSSMQLYSQYAQQLVLKDRVDVVQGGITSASREAIRPTLDRYKTLYFYNTQYEGGVCDRNVFCTGTTPAQTVDHVVTYAMKTWGKKAYIIAADYNYGQITAKWMTKFVRDGGGSVARTDFFPLDVTDFSSTISRIQQAAPEFVLSALVGSNQEGFYRQWAAAGMKGKIPMASTVFGLSDELMTMEPATTDGIVTCYGWYNDLGTPASDAFVKGMQAKYGAGVTDLGELDSATYEGIMIWAEAVKKAGSVEQQKVIAALESGIVIDGPSGKVTMDPKTHHTIRNAYLAQPQSRKWQIMATYPDQYPADTGGACDLIKNPKTDKQFEPSI
ncbi:MAG TPA: ABC transporter substrate-binding protein [Rhodopila sp.]